MGLIVTDTPVAESDNDTPEVGWYVSHVDPDGDLCAIPLRFARRRDAQAAMEAAIGNGIVDWEGTHDEISRRVLRYGWRRLRQQMLEVLSW